MPQRKTQFGTMSGPVSGKNGLKVEGHFVEENPFFSLNVLRMIPKS